jgi:hypothetical protein
VCVCNLVQQFAILTVFFKVNLLLFINKDIFESNYTRITVCFCVLKLFLKKFKFFLFFSLLQINMFLIFLDHFDALISKIIF